MSSTNHSLGVSFIIKSRLVGTIHKFLWKVSNRNQYVDRYNILSIILKISTGTWIQISTILNFTEATHTWKWIQIMMFKIKHLNAKLGAVILSKLGRFNTCTNRYRANFFRPKKTDNYLEFLDSIQNNP